MACFEGEPIEFKLPEHQRELAEKFYDYLEKQVGKKATPYQGPLTAPAFNPFMQNAFRLMEQSQYGGAGQFAQAPELKTFADYAHYDPTLDIPTGFDGEPPFTPVDTGQPPPFTPIGDRGKDIMQRFLSGVRAGGGGQSPTQRPTGIGPPQMMALMRQLSQQQPPTGQAPRMLGRQAGAMPPMGGMGLRRPIEPRRAFLR